MRRTFFKLLFPFIAPLAVLFIFFGITIIDIGIIQVTKCVLANLSKISKEHWLQRPTRKINPIQSYSLWIVSIPISVVVFVLQRGMS